MKNLTVTVPKQVSGIFLKNPIKLQLSIVALCGWAAKADDSFVCFGAKPDKGFLDLKSRHIRKWEGDAREGVDGGPGGEQLALDSREASSRELAWNHGQGQSTPDTRAERRGSMG